MKESMQSTDTTNGPTSKAKLGSAHQIRYIKTRYNKANKIRWDEMGLDRMGYDGIIYDKIR